MLSRIAEYWLGDEDEEDIIGLLARDRVQQTLQSVRIERLMNPQASPDDIAQKVGTLLPNLRDIGSQELLANYASSIRMHRG